MITKLQIRDYLKAPYTRVVVPDEDGVFVAEVLEFEGCFADGKTAGEALRNLDKIAAAWIAARLDSGRPIPEPHGHWEMSGRFALRLPQSLHSKAAIHAEREGISLNTFFVASIAASVGMLDLVDKYTSKIQDQVINYLQLTLEIKGTRETWSEITQQMPVQAAGTIPALSGR